MELTVIAMLPLPKQTSAPKMSENTTAVYVYSNRRSGTRVPVNDGGYDTMGNKTDQIKGFANQAVGKLKQGVGKITGSKQTQAKGVAQEVKGQGQQTMGKARSAVKDVADKANKKL